jgi:transcriptional regulator with XRE-family HTH domain
VPGKPIGDHSLTSDWAPRPITRLYGKLLKDGREKAGLAQRDVAERIGVAQSTLGRWEKGEIQPDFEALRALAGLYRCKMSDLVPRNQYPSAPLNPAERQFWVWRRNARIQGWDEEEYVEIMQAQRERAGKPRL